jgi:hypothetical protein
MYKPDINKTVYFSLRLSDENNRNARGLAFILEMIPI